VPVPPPGTAPASGPSPPRSPCTEWPSELRSAS
jgi:hypothetical protein